MSTYYMVFTAGKLFLNSAAVKIMKDMKHY